jgi:PilZ domain-containing protein
MLPFHDSPTLQEQSVKEISGDRRSRRRYPTDLAVQYKVMKNYLVVGTGNGKTLSMSSKGIAFTANETFKVGSHLELSVSWPVLLNGSCGMKLVVEGKVVRSNGESTAIRMDRYEFRTQARPAVQPAPALCAAATSR